MAISQSAAAAFRDVGAARGQDIQAQQFRSAIGQRQREFDLNRQDQREQFVFEQLGQVIEQAQAAALPLVQLGRVDAAEAAFRSAEPAVQELAQSADLFGGDVGSRAMALYETALAQTLAVPTAQDVAVGEAQAQATGEQAFAEATDTRPATAVAQERELAEIALINARRQQVIQQSAQFAREIAEGKSVKSDLVDERGSLKSEVSQDLFRMAVTFVNPTATPDEQSGMIIGLSQDQVKLAQQVATVAADLIETGQVRNENQAMLAAMGAIEIPRVEAAVPLTPDKRQELLDQNATIELLAPAAQDLISKAPLATGLLSATRAGIDATLGQALNFFGLKDEPLFEDTQQARDDVARFNQIIAQTLVNNPRFPKWERNLINSLLVDPNEWFSNPARAAAKMQNLFAHMQTRLQNNRNLLAGKPLVPTTSGIAPEGPIQPGTQGGVPTIRNKETGEVRQLRDGEWVTVEQPKAPLAE